MTRPGNFSRNNSVVSRAVWRVAPSCCNHVFRIHTVQTEATKIPLSCCDKVRHSLLLHFRPHFRKSTAQSVCQPKIPTKQYLIVHAMAFHESPPRLSAPQIRQLCVFTYTSNWKCASSLKMIFFEKLPSIFFCWFSNTKLGNSTIIRSVTRSLGRPKIHGRMM